MATVDGQWAVKARQGKAKAVMARSRQGKGFWLYLESSQGQHQGKAMAIDAAMQRNGHGWLHAKVNGLWLCLGKAIGKAIGNRLVDRLQWLDQAMAMV